MTVYREYKMGGTNNPFGAYGGLVILILLSVAVYFIAKGIFTVLSMVAPFLLIASLVIDYTATVDFGKFIIKLFKNNILIGILAVLLTVVGFPVVAGFLFFRSIVRRKIKSMTKEMRKAEEGSYTEYEVVEEDQEFLELPELEKQNREDSSEYEDLFK